jgi:hypothetical protein
MATADGLHESAGADVADLGLPQETPDEGPVDWVGWLITDASFVEAQPLEVVVVRLKYLFFLLLIHDGEGEGLACLAHATSA